VVRHDEDALDSSGGDVLEAGGDGSRHPLRTAALVVGAAALAVWAYVGSDGDDPSGSVDDVTQPSPGAPGDVRPSASAPEADGVGSGTGALLDAGAASGTAGAFYDFASTGDAEDVSGLWADWVTVSTPRRTWTMTSREASDREAWRRGPDTRGRRGHRDLLRPLTRSGGSFSVYLDDVRCFGSGELRTVNPVGRVTSRVLVALRPSVGTACAHWWSVDLVFTPEDRISQVHVER
jgi:hypothetical protein